MKHAVIDSATNICVNIVVWDGSPKWSPPDGHFTSPLSDGDTVGIGWGWDGNALTVPPPTLPAPPPDLIEELRQALKDDPLLLEAIKKLK